MSFIPAICIVIYFYLIYKRSPKEDKKITIIFGVIWTIVYIILGIISIC
jgi:tryptophan-rich sensory protein